MPKLTVEFVEGIAKRMAAEGLLSLEEGFRRYRIGGVPWCDAPGGYELHGSHSSVGANDILTTNGLWFHKKKPITLRGLAPCRKCERCLRLRELFWTERALVEWRRWPRSLFGTVTLSPDEHYALDARVTARLAKGRVRFSDLTEAEVFKERCHEYGKDLAKYFKRIRKGAAGSPVRFRYLLVAEPHDGDKTSEELRGRPHFHLLIHELEVGSLVLGDPLSILLGVVEQDGDYELRWVKERGKWQRGAFVADHNKLRTSWELGFTKFRYVADKFAATYVCKYLSKSLLYKVRASTRYGLLAEAKLDRSEGETSGAEAEASLKL